MMELEISSMAGSDDDINNKHHKYRLDEALQDYSDLSDYIRAQSISIQRL